MAILSIMFVGLILCPLYSNAYFEWAQVKHKLDELDTNKGSTKMWAAQLHANPDVYLVHGFLTSEDTDKLLSLHNETIKVTTEHRLSNSLQNDAWLSQQDMVVPWCFVDRGELDRWRHKNYIRGRVAQNTQGMWCVFPDASASNTLPTTNVLDESHSEGTVYIRGDVAFIDNLEQRADEQLGLHPMHAYHGQVVHYPQTAGYKLHTDCHHITDRFANNRAISSLVYLEDHVDGGGGETVFPRINVVVTPEKGMAIVWNNLDDDGNCDARTQHASKPLTSGAKAIFQRWYYQRPVLPEIWRDAVNCDGSGSCRRYTNTVKTRLANALFDKAANLKKQSDIPTILSLYKEAVISQPAHVQSLVGLAYVSEHLTDKQESITWFEKVVERFPVHTGARFKLAEWAEDHGRVREALAHYNYVIQFEPNKTDPLLRAMNAAWNAGMMKEAREYLVEAAKLDPENVEIQNALVKATEILDAKHSEL